MKNVKVGQVFKNYLEMCHQLGLEVKQQGSRQYQQQLKQLKAYFEFERLEGTRQIRVTRVYADDSLVLNVPKHKHADILAMLKLANMLQG